MAQDFFSVQELESTKFDVMPFDGKWLASFGRPEKSGVWIVYGESYNGKTNFTIQLAKYLTQFVKSKILINSLEEGKSESLKLTTKRSNLSTVSDKILLGNRVGINKVKERLRKQRSPEIIITDSIQYTELDKDSYKALKKEFPKKLFIFLSHVDGKDPRGSLAKFVKYDSDVKIKVQGFKAFFKSRYGGGEPFIIDEKRAAIYHGDIK